MSVVKWLRHPAIIPVSLIASFILLAASAGIIAQRHFADAAPIASATTPTLHTVTAYIVGAITKPGVYTVAVTARVQDIVNAAGGVTSEADLVRLNLAAPVFDGEEIYVPKIGEPYPDFIGGTGIRVNINLATETTLRDQLGLSAKTAEAIIAYRKAHGPFTSVEQLLLVPISRTIYDRIKDLVTV